MNNHFRTNTDEEIMAVSCFAGALLYLCAGQTWAAASLVFGFVAGEAAFYLNQSSERLLVAADIASPAIREEKVIQRKAA